MRNRLVTLFAALSLATAVARGQQPLPAVLADSIAAAGDTARAVALLDSVVRVDKRNAAAWHQLGLLLWNQGKAARSPGIMTDQRAIRLLIGADTALKLATHYAPDSARFLMSLHDFNASSGLSTTMIAAGGNASKAIVAAEKTGDMVSLARALTGRALVAWRQYEKVARIALPISNAPNFNIRAVSERRDRAVDYIDSYYRLIEPPTGTADYSTAIELFQRALDAEPSNQRYARHVYMALGERGRWGEMRAVAKHRTSMFPLDWQAQMARGLAAHRQGDNREAQAAFDSALVLMDNDSRERYTSITRILRPDINVDYRMRGREGMLGDTTKFRQQSWAHQQMASNLYWLLSDPLAITPENESRNEFLARIAWAEFRWTNEDQNLRGADTDRGDIFIRYGPPAKDFIIGGNGDTDGRATSWRTLVWSYPDGLTFFFEMMVGFASARTSWADKEYVDLVRHYIPVSFANVPESRLPDTIPVAVTRFRATGDSVDVVIAASIPAHTMTKDLEMTEVPIKIDMRLYDRNATMRGSEALNADVRPDTAKHPLLRSWTRRVGGGFNVLRVEALQEDTRRAARSVSALETEAATGFGMSDILLGSSPNPRSDRPQRWTDVAIVPQAGAFVNPQVGLVWELYDLAAADGQSKYRMEIVIEREAGLLSRFAARIVDGVGATLGREQRGRNRLAFTFDRAAPASPVLVEYLTLNLTGASPGEHRLTVTVTDLANGQKTTRTSAFFLQ